MKFSACQIGELAERYGEQCLGDYLRTFKCPLNPEVETFLWNKSLVSAKLCSSQTYIVVNEGENYIAGYYTLVLKAYSVRGSLLSSKNRRLIARFAEEDEKGNFHAAVYLIAQIGKNFAIPEDKRISGAELIGMALDELRAIKSRIGGKLVMVERENDRPQLQAFYQDNGFKSWTSRSDAHDGVCYDQMFAAL